MTTYVLSLLKVVGYVRIAGSCTAGLRRNAMVDIDKSNALGDPQSVPQSLPNLNEA